MELHNKLIKEAASRHLTPLGGIQKGRSYRKEGHVEFVNEEQFAREADLLAQRAAQEVGMLRAKLHSPLVVHAMTPKNTGEKWVDRFHRGISLGLAGRVDDAAFVLGTAQEDSAKLVALLPDAQAFERKLIEQIGVRRKALKFPVLDGLPWNLGNAIA